jgi:cyclase
MKAQTMRLLVVPLATFALAASAFFMAADSAAQAQREPRSIFPLSVGNAELDVHHVDGIDVVYVQGNVYMLVGAGPNLVASIGEEGVLLVDSGPVEASEKVLAALRTMSPDRPIQYILNTQFNENHTGGNEPLAIAGRRLRANTASAAVLAREEVLNSMAASRRPGGAWPTDTYFTDRKEVYFNREPLIMYHRPAVTNGDSFVFFRRSDVIAAGDIYRTDSFPYIDLEAGGHINGIIEGLNDILDLAIPANIHENGTLIVPGHGRLSDGFDVAVYRDMVTIIRDRVQEAIARGMTLEQVKSDSRITLEYEGRYGSQTGSWTTEMFLEAVYENLTSERSGEEQQ